MSRSLQFIACVQTAVLIPTAVLETDTKKKALKGFSPFDHDSMASVTLCSATLAGEQAASISA